MTGIRKDGKMVKFSLKINVDLINGEIVKSLYKFQITKMLDPFVLIRAVYVPEKISFITSSPTFVGFFVCGMMGRFQHGES
mgnify:CR=1 FL=1